MSKSTGTFSLRIFTSTIIAVLAVVSLSACYDEGPWLSFRSKKTRICGDWNSVKVMVDGTELENEGGQRTVTFSEDGTYTDVKGDSLSGLFVNKGFWDFTEGKDSLLITVRDEFTGLEYTMGWEIRRLAYKEIGIHNTTAGHETEWWLERK